MAIVFHLTINAAAVNRIGMREARRQVLDTLRAVRNRADVLTPVDTGILRRNNQMRQFERGLVVTGEVYNTASYAKAVHDGHSGSGPYIIRPRRKKALRFVINGEVVIVKKVNHPGIPPMQGRPWLKRALEEVAPPHGFVITR